MSLDAADAAHSLAPWPKGQFSGPGTADSVVAFQPAPIGTYLAARYPEKLRQLQDQWWVEAAKYNVLPLDWRAGIRMNDEAMGRPSLTRGRTKMEYFAGMTGLPDAAPAVLNKSWTITAEVDLPDAKTNGMIVTDGGGMGKGGTVTLTANGKKVAEGRLARTVPNKLSICEGLDIGMDNGSPVDFTYKMPFAFTGKIEKVTIELKPEVAKAPRAGRRRRAASPRGAGGGGARGARLTRQSGGRVAASRRPRLNAAWRSIPPRSRFRIQGSRRRTPGLSPGCPGEKFR